MEPPGESPTPKPPLILCVDDDPTIRAVTRKALERKGFRVRVASELEEAIAAVESAREAVSLVILDRTMPGMEVEAVVGRLKEMQPGLKVVLTSGYDRATAMASVSRRLVDGFLQKPYNPKQLAELVQRVLGSSTKAFTSVA